MSRNRKLPWKQVSETKDRRVENLVYIKDKPGRLKVGEDNAGETGRSNLRNCARCIHKFVVHLYI